MVEQNIEKSSIKEQFKDSVKAVMFAFGISLGVAAIAVFAYLLIEVLPNKMLDDELKGKDLNSVDGEVVIHINDKIKSTSNNKIAYLVSVDQMVFPWRSDRSFKRGSTESLVPVTKEQFEALKVNATYQIEYHKTINQKDTSPVIQRYQEM